MFAFRALVFVALPLCACAAVTTSPSATASATGDANREQTLTQLGELTHAAAGFEAVFGRCPLSVAELRNPPSGGALFTSSELDGWGHPIAFMPASEENPASAFVSGGPDGALLTTDDVSLASPCTRP